MPISGSQPVSVGFLLDFCLQYNINLTVSQSLLDICVDCHQQEVIQFLLYFCLCPHQHGAQQRCEKPCKNLIWTTNILRAETFRLQRRSLLATVEFPARVLKATAEEPDSRYVTEVFV